jgi:hypothetical protein
MFEKSWAPTGSLWPQARTRYVSGPAAAVAKLSLMLDEFERALRSVHGTQADALRLRIRGASSKDDLWYMRSEIFDIVSRHFDQWEAQSRLRDLDALFEQNRSPGRAKAR